MPIRRHHRWLYPIDWRELSATIRFRRAKMRRRRLVDLAIRALRVA